MTSRARVLTALNHEEPDRVPLVLWGSYYTLNDEIYFNLLKYLKMGDPMISPDMFRTIFKPALAKIIQSVKDYRPDLPVVFHSDGAITEIIPDLIEIGLDVLNPLEPLPAPDWVAIKGKYGRQRCVMGGIDIRQAMTGPVKGVIEEVKKRISIFGPGGGYLVTSANHMQIDVPPENIVALFDAARKFGRYPLR